MSKKLQLMVLAGSLVGALGLFVVMNNAEEEPVVPVADESVTVIDFLEEDVEKIEITQGDEKLTFYPVIVEIVTPVESSEESADTSDEDDASEPEMIIEEDIDWEIEEGEGLDLDGYRIEGFARDALVIDASRTVDQVDLEGFGFADSAYKVTYFLKDGTQTTLTIGEKSLDGSSAYVMKDDETDVAYLVPSYEVEGFKDPLSHYRNDMLEKVDSTLITEITVSGESMDTFYFYPSEQQYIGGEFMMQVNDEEPMLAAFDPMQQSLQAIPMIQIQNYIDENVTDLAQYGLDNPALKATFVQKVNAESVETSEVTYLWGDDYGSDEIYFMKEGTTSVYTMKKSSVDAWVATLDPFKMIEKMGIMEHINDVDQIEVSQGDEVFTLRIEREEVVVEPEEGSEEDAEAEEPAEPEVELVETFFINDQQVEEDLFRDIYAMMIGMKIDTEIDAVIEADQEPEAAIKFDFIDGTEKAHQFYAYSDQFYSYALSDTQSVGWNIKQFNYLITKLQEVTTVTQEGDTE